MTYEDWYAAVNEMFKAKYGLDMDDCGDWLSRDCYDSDMTVEEGFAEAELTMVDPFFRQ